MKKTAKAQIKEVVREVVEDYIKIDVGVDESTLSSMGEQTLIRTVVVLHGNTHRNDMIKTRPGQDTWKKHVNYHDINKVSKSVYDLPQFVQDEDMGTPITENAIKQVKVYFEDAIKQMSKLVDSIHLFVNVS